MWPKIGTCISSSILPRLNGCQEYIGSVESVSLNATYASVLIDGRVYLHQIERGDGRTTIFPRKEDEKTITCASIVGNFLIYAHSNGRLQYYSLVDGQEVNEYKHANGIRKCFPNHEGTRVALIDTAGTAWLYNPINDDCIQILDFPLTADRVLWDSSDATIFVACDQFNLHTFVYSQIEVGGSGRSIRYSNSPRILQGLWGMPRNPCAFLRVWR